SRRPIPLARYQAWLRLCKTKDSFKNLLPLYFPNSGSCGFELNEINCIKVSSTTISRRKFMLHKRALMRRMKTGCNASGRFVVDELKSSELQMEVDQRLIQASLSSSPVFWKSKPQFRNLTKKHPAAICGVIVVKERRLNDSFCSFGVESSPTTATESRAEVEIDSPTVRLMKEVRNEKPNCRYCGSDENVHRSGPCSTRLTCEKCESFLSSTCSSLSRIEDAVCIKNPTCRILHPGPSNADKPHPIPSTWCNACKLFRYVQLGFRPNVMKKKKLGNTAVLHYLNVNRLSKPSLTSWARGKRCIEFFSDQINTKCDILEIGQRDITQLATFLDVLWCRAVLINFPNPSEISAMVEPPEACQVSSMPQVSVEKPVSDSDFVLNTNTLHDDVHEAVEQQLNLARSCEHLATPTLSTGDGPKLCMIECKICSEPSSNVYAVTIGPARLRNSVNQPHVSVCGGCVLRCRKSAVRVAQNFSDIKNDTLCQWYYTYKRDGDGSVPLCECTEIERKCDFCHLEKCITLFRLHLTPWEALEDTEEESNIHLEAIGSPLFLACCHPLPDGISKNVELYSRLIQRSPTEEDQPFCALCRTTVSDLFRLTNGTVTCELCALGYKAVLTLLGRRSQSSDIALLAQLMALPCNPRGHKTEQLPLWAVCPSCHARRCLRLLHPLEPCLHLPHWLKRRARLVFFNASNPSKEVTLNDLDPGISISKKLYKGSIFYNVATSMSQYSAEEERSNKRTEVILMPGALNFPKPSNLREEDSNAFDSDSSCSCASSSLRVLSEADSDSENVQKHIKSGEGKAASDRTLMSADVNGEDGSAVLQSPSDALTVLRDRRQRRLTAKYAEALEEQTRRRRFSARRGSGSGITQPSNLAASLEKVSVVEIAPAEKVSATDATTLKGDALAQHDMSSTSIKAAKRSRQSTTPVKIIEGKRKPKVNSRLQGDYAVLDLQGKWNSAQKPLLQRRRSICLSDDARSDTSSTATSCGGLDRRNHRRNHPITQKKGGPRIKQVGRKPFAESSYEKAMSAMVHAAKLAAVGAQTQDGTSPLIAASAATAEAYCSDGSSADGSNPLKVDCGICAACKGLTKPCGRCSNCRLQAHYGNGKSVGNQFICKETLCFRRKSFMAAKSDRPRVKLPSNFSPRSYQKAMKSSKQVTPPLPGPTPQPSLLDTVPGLQEQLLSHSNAASRLSQPQSATLTQSASVDSLSSATLRAESANSSVVNNLEVFADAPVRSLRGGDLGMHFAPHDSTGEDGPGSSSKNKIRPVDGEVIDIDLAYQGGYPVVTTLAAAPPKEICYACGSGGGQLLFCVSCAEPFHFYCVERQFRPKKKDHFLCRNCTPCAKCNQSASELRCIRCFTGFHPGCLAGYAPAQSAERGKWVCPDCTHCLHCLVKPLDREVASYRTGDVSARLVPWSSEPSKCAECSEAEAKGQVCPECDRAYLQDTMEMIQCDSCHLWRHRACAKLTSDQYELIARAPPSQLRTFTIYCSACKAEVTAHSSDTHEGEGDEKLRRMANDTLTKRMQTLVDGCTSSPMHHSNDLDQSQPNSFAGGESSEGATVSEGSPQRPPHESNSLPQLDGGLDDSPVENSQSSSSQVNPVSFEHTPTTNNGGTHLRPPSLVKKAADVAFVPAWTVRIHLNPPPMHAAWLVERSTSDEWTTPRALAYTLLARLIARIDSTPATSTDFLPLRKLLDWLSKSIEVLFPWLPASDSTKEVRDLLRQAQGSLSTVVTFLRTTVELELFELACSHIAVILDETRTRLAIQSYIYSHVARMRTLGLYEKCSRWVNSHLQAYHHEIADFSRQVEDAQEFFIKHREIHARCFDPRVLQEKLEARLEAKDEKWVEHWSNVEDRIAIFNFQKELFLKWQRILNDPIQSPVKNPLGIESVGRISTKDPIYHFGSSFYWESLEREYADLMLPVTSPPPVDLDESEPETAEESGIKALPLATIIQEEKRLLSGSIEEPRKCLLCTRNTDDSIEGRLIYIGSDVWIHVNCALWSNEVYEEESGQLAGVSAALRRGGRTRCEDCGNLGATMTCSNSVGGCRSVVHFTCALRRRRPTFPQPVFTADRSFFCSPTCHSTVRRIRFAEAIRNLNLRRHHRFYVDEETEQGVEDKRDDRDVFSLIDSKVISVNEAQDIARQIDSDLERITLNDMLVCRRVFVPSDCFVASLRGGIGGQYETTDEQQPVLSLAISPSTVALIQNEVPASSFVVTIGALRIDRLGHIAEASDSLVRKNDRDNPGYICPIGYRARRIYWSVHSLGSRTTYTLNVSQVHKPPAISLPHLESMPNLSNSHKDKRCLPNFSLKNCAYEHSKTLHPTQPMPNTLEIPVAASATSTSLPGSIIPTPCSSRNSATAFDPHPNNPIGLPSIRFTFPQGVPPSRFTQKPPAGSLQPSATNSRSEISQSLTTSPPPPSTQKMTISCSSASTQKGASSHSQPLIITATSSAPSPPKFATILSPHKNTTPRIVSAVSVPKSSTSSGAVAVSLPNPITVYSISSASQNSLITHVNVVKPPSIQVPENRASIHTTMIQPTTVDVKRGSTLVRCVPAANVIVAPSTPPPQQTKSHLGSISQPVVIHRLDRVFATSSVGGTTSSVYSFPRTVRVASVSTPATVTSTGASGKYPVTNVDESHLASQLDGIFSSLKSPEKLTIIASSSLPKIANPTQAPVSQQQPIRIPQLSQLDGINDMEDMEGFLPSNRHPAFRESAVSGRGCFMQKVTSAKKKWMLERENRLELNERVLKAKQTLTDRMYQKEATSFADSFRLQFSVDTIGKATYTPAAAWREVVDRVIKLRTDQKLPQMIVQDIDGWSQFGLNHRHVVFLLEQLPGAFNCYRYRFRYHQHRINRLRESYKPPVPVLEGAARLMPCSKAPPSKSHARDPLAFLHCRANYAPHSCLPYDVCLDPGDAVGPGCGNNGDRTEGCLNAARQAAFIVANSLKLPPRLHARTVEAAVAEATADAVEEAEDAAASGRGRNQLSVC
uniref:SET domain-containing protein n=1 Tax=Mesocestoides corti TaxID=53468 RepID=A0A5K3EYC8_MESCO